MLWLIGIPVVLFLGLIVLALFFELIKTGLGFNGAAAAGRLYWGIFLFVVWVGISVGCLFAFFFVFGPIFEYFGSRDAKGGALGPEITIGFALMLLMAVPVIATKATVGLNRLKSGD